MRIRQRDAGSTFCGGRAYNFVSFPMKVAGSLPNSEWWPPLRRYAQFCIVGGSGVILDMGVLYLLADPSTLGWNLTLSKVIAAEVAIFNNFLWNELWTFRDVTVVRKGWSQQAGRFF